MSTTMNNILLRKQIRMLVGTLFRGQTQQIEKKKNGLTSPHLCTCPKSGPELVASYAWSFFNDCKWYAIVSFEIGGIVGRHHSNFLFLNS